MTDRDPSRSVPFSGIERACLHIAYDNGGVNRYRPEKLVRKKIADFLASRPYNDQFAVIDAWLKELSAEQLETVCAGEQTEAAAITANAPAFTDTLLEEYFEETC